MGTPESTLVSTTDSLPSTATTTASVRLRLSPSTPTTMDTPTPDTLATPDTPDTLTLVWATATPATTTDKSLEDREPKAIGPNVAPWWRKPIVLLTWCVTCAKNKKGGKGLKKKKKKKK